MLPECDDTICLHQHQSQQASIYRYARLHVMYTVGCDSAEWVQSHCSPLAALRWWAEPPGCRCRWNRPCRFSSCSGCCPGGGLQTAGKISWWGEATVVVHACLMFGKGVVTFRRKYTSLIYDLQTEQNKQNKTVTMSLVSLSLRAWNIGNQNKKKTKNIYIYSVHIYKYTYTEYI